VQKLGVDAHSGAAAALPSAAWRLVDALASLRGPGGKVRIPGFYEDVLAPTQAQLDALANQPDTEALMRAHFQVEEFVNGLTGKELRQLAGFLTGYTGEGVKTVLPARAMAKMDFRLVPNQDPDDIFAKLRAHLDAEGFTDVKLIKLGGAEPIVTPMEHPLVQRIKAIAEAFSGKPANINPLMGGTLPLLGALKRYVGVPGLCAPGNIGYLGSGAHAPNENVRLSDIERAVKFNCYMFQELGR
jgi:acetylornithine deacetylase/succinyl-diaminopimelate desuccinylase-like protein